MTRKEPLTVLLPVRDAQTSVGFALCDLIAGVRPSDEILVVDDGSIDSTPQVLGRLRSLHPQIRVVRTTGVGLVGALNLGLREAGNRWIARADADDRYPANRLEVQRSAIRSDVVLIAGDYRQVSQGRLIGEIPCALGHPFVSMSLVNPQRIPHPGVMFDREAVLAAGGYRKEDFPAEDLGLWLRLAHDGQLVGVPHVVVNWSMSPKSISQSHQGAQRAKTAELLERMLPALGLSQMTRLDVATELARYASASRPGERRVLLARDVRSARGLGVDQSVYRAVVRAVQSHPASSTLALGRLAAEQARRRRLRRGFSA